MYKPPATSITAATATANNAVTKSWISFIVPYPSNHAKHLSGKAKLKKNDPPQRVVFEL